MSEDRGSFPEDVFEKLTPAERQAYLDQQEALARKDYKAALEALRRLRAPLWQWSSP